MTATLRSILCLLGLGLLATGIYLVHDFVASSPTLPGLPDQDPTRTPNYYHLLRGIVFIMIGAGLVMPVALRLLAAPFHAMVDSIYAPRHPTDKPPMDLELPAFYEREKRFQEALDEYRKIIRYHPEKTPGWLGALRLLLAEFDDPDGAEALYRKANRRFRGDSEALALIEETWAREHGDTRDP